MLFMALISLSLTHTQTHTHERNNNTHTHTLQHFTPTTTPITNFTTTTWENGDLRDTHITIHKPGWQIPGTVRMAIPSPGDTFLANCNFSKALYPPKIRYPNVYFFLRQCAWEFLLFRGWGGKGKGKGKEKKLWDCDGMGWHGMGWGIRKRKGKGKGKGKR